MQTLYIIGNGFDCYAHDMPTQYSDFKNYLVQRFPDYQKDYGGILSYTIAPDGAENYDMNEVVGAIIRTLERVYGIGDARICHIHGDVGCEKEDIYFGHGNDEEFACFTQYIGIEDAFSRLKYVLKKDTKSALERNVVFFNKLSGINKI